MTSTPTGVCRVTGKVRHHNVDDAWNVIDRIRRHPSASRSERRAYRCPHCDGWHLTSQPRSTIELGATPGHVRAPHTIAT